MQETLQEYCDSRGVTLAVDAQGGVIRGVKILGLSSRNGRRYLESALSAAAALYEGAKVNVNHPKGHPAAPRDYQERLGQIRNVALRSGDGLFGDLHYNPRHALAGQLAWDAAHWPENVGLSHNVRARTARRDDALVVEAILAVHSVDLVADPASTRGLFEAQPPLRQQPPERAALESLSLDELRRSRPDLVEQLLAPLESEVGRLGDEAARLRSAERLARRRLAVKQLLAEFGLPDPDTCDPHSRQLVGQGFLESLLEADDEGEVRRLVEERARLVGASRALGGRPTAREQLLVEDVSGGPRDGAEFARAIS